MTPRAYYNEFDPKAAAWLRELIAAGLIAPGEVDERSITDVSPDDLRGFTQCHFFAGIGGWSLALRLAGWPDYRSVGTGSCPCQPFSDAGRQAGFSDPRHLWPAFFRLIASARQLGQPWAATLFGEQVASKAALGWLDGVFADMEGAHYACAAADLCAAGIGAPHIRQRLFWVAYSTGGESGDSHLQRGGQHGFREEVRRDHGDSGNCERAEASGSEDRWLADGDGERCARREESHGGAQRSREPAPCRDDAGGCGVSGRVVHAVGAGLEGYSGNGDHGDESRRLGALANGSAPEAGGGGAWDDFVLVPCADGKARRIEPGLAPLAHGVPARVVRVRGYGNAIVPELAAEFIQSAEEAVREAVAL